MDKISNRTRNGMKTDIAVIKTEIKFISTAIKQIQENTKEFPTVKNDVKWLKYWHNKIVIGVIIAIVVSGYLGAIKLIAMING